MIADRASDTETSTSEPTSMEEFMAPSPTASIGNPECGMRRRPLAIVVTLSLLVCAIASAQNLPGMFQQAREAFQSGHYEKSLQLFDQIDEISRQPQHQSDRQQLEAPLHFFRAANLAMLRKNDEAVDEFLEFLRLNPQAALKEGSYPRPVLAAFDEARHRFANGGASLATAYRSFLQTDRGGAPTVDASWGDSAVRELLTDDEKSVWKSLDTDADRQAFVDKFWLQRDPTPGTPSNELREEIDARMRFADAQWSSGDTPGRDSDRALVFVLLGPPDSIDTQQVGVHNQELANERAQHSTGTGTRFGSSAESQQRVTWVYSGDNVPGYLGMGELRYTFFVRHGQAVLETSGRAYKALREIAEHIDQSHMLH